MATRRAARRPAGVTEPDPASPIVVFCGKEGFLRAERTRSLHEAMEKAGGEVEITRFDGAEAAIADVLDACRSLSLLQQRKLVVVDNAQHLVKETNRRLMERYAQQPTAGATLALRCEQWRAGKLDKLIIEAGGAIIQCDTPTPSQATQWITKRCGKQWGLELDHQAAALLVDRVGTGLERLDSELAKLAAAASGSSIDAELVAELVPRTRQEEVWALQSKLLSGDAEEALVGLDEAIELSAQPTPLIFYASIDLARKLHTASQALAQGAGPHVAAKEAKLWGATRDRALSVASRTAPRKLAALLEDAVEADAMCKSGRANPRRSLEALAIRFASLTGAAADGASGRSVSLARGGRR